MWNKGPDPIVISVAIQLKPSTLTLIICFIPPFLSRSLTKMKTAYVFDGSFITSSTKYRVFESPISYIFLLVGGEDGTYGLSPVNTPIIILWFIVGLSLVNVFINFSPDPPKLSIRLPVK